MTMVLQKLDAVRFRCDRVIVGISDHDEIREVDLESTWRAAIGPNRPANDERSLLAKVIGTGEDFVTDGGSGHHDLNEPGSVA